MDARIKRFIESVGATADDFEALDLHVTLVKYKQEGGGYGDFVPLVVRGSGLEVQAVGVGIVKAMIIRRRQEQKERAAELVKQQERVAGRFEYSYDDFCNGVAEASQLGWEAGDAPPRYIGVGNNTYKYTKRIMDASNEDCLGWEYDAVAGYSKVKILND